MFYAHIAHVLCIIIFDVFTGYAVAQWLGLHLQLLGVAMVAGVSFLAVLANNTLCTFFPAST